MSYGILISIGCAFGWLFFNFSRKHLSHRFSSVGLAVYIMYAQLPFHLFLTLQEQWQLDPLHYFFYSIIAGAFNLFGNLFFIIGVKHSPFSVSVPILAFIPAFAAVGSYFVYDQEMSSFQILGIALIIFGAFILIRKSLKEDHHSHERLALGIGLMFVVSACWAITPIFDKKCLEFTSSPFHAFFQCLLIGSFLHIYLKLKARKLEPLSQVVQHKWIFALGVLASVSAILLQFEAIQVINIGIVESIKKSIELSGSLIIGYLVYKEKLGPHKLLAIVLLGLGACFVVLTSP